MSRRVDPRLLLALAVLACGDAGGGPAAVFDPDVPRWRGGCFVDGPAGKIVNASPSSDVRSFGTACADPPGPGGLVYLDGFDPISGAGDVTVLSAAPGSAPVVVARRGGGGAVDIGSTGAVLDEGHARLLTLADVRFVTGDLVLAELPEATTQLVIGSGVRIQNYDFTAGGGVLYVGDYDPDARTGNLVHWTAEGPRVVAEAASRFDFVMYRLSPERARVAYLRGWTSHGGGDLFVQPLPPGPAPASLVASGVFRMAWTPDGRHLVFRTVNPDGITYALWSWDGTSPPRALATEVVSAQLLGSSVLYATGWSVLSQGAALHLVPAAGGEDVLAGVGPASLEVAAGAPAGLDGILAFALVPDGASPATGALSLTPVDRFAPVHVDSGVSLEAGFGISPLAGFVTYAVGYDAEQAPGSANPQPGVARELRLAPAAGGAPFVLAEGATTAVAWDPRDRYVAALAGFDRARSHGELVVRAASTGAELLRQPAVGLGSFAFAPDGAALWALRGWDDAFRAGELVGVATEGGRAWSAAAIDRDVTCMIPFVGGRVIYCVRGSGREGLWSGAVGR